MSKHHYYFRRLIVWRFSCLEWKKPGLWSQTKLCCVSDLPGVGRVSLGWSFSLAEPCEMGRRVVPTLKGYLEEYLHTVNTSFRLSSFRVKCNKWKCATQYTYWHGSKFRVEDAPVNTVFYDIVLNFICSIMATFIADLLWIRGWKNWRVELLSVAPCIGSSEGVRLLITGCKHQRKGQNWVRLAPPCVSCMPGTALAVSSVQSA